jgi:lysine-N-methylase
MCSNYPRVLNSVGGLVERSLYLSCPEAARLVLTDPDAMLFEDSEAEVPPHRAAVVSSIDDTFAEHLRTTRAQITRILKERSRPFWLRMTALGLAIDKLAAHEPEFAATILEEHLQTLRRGAFEGIVGSREEAMSLQFETALELIIGRISAEYTAPRFLECYADFMRGLGWTNESTMPELLARYRFASQNYLQPFLDRHGYFFENWALNHVFRSLFPYGAKRPDQTMTIDARAESVRDSFALMAGHYAIMRTVLIGMSALYGQDLTMGHALKVVQSATKAFQHSRSFAVQMLQYFANQPGDRMRNLAALLANVQ